MKTKILLLFASLFFCQVIEAQLNINHDVNWEICDNNLDGQEAVDLSSSIPLISSNNNYVYSFFKTLSNAQSNINPIVSINNFLVNGNTTLFVRVTDPQSGQTDIARLTVTLKNCLSAQDISTKPRLLVYPNPTSSVLYIKADNLNYSEIYDVNGHIILKSKSDEINVTNLKSGLYVLKTYSGNNIEATKFLKN